jgi:PAS domain S-box-containing protein
MVADAQACHGISVRKETYDLDVDEWMARPENQRMAQEDQGTALWVQQGYKHVLVGPIRRGNDIVAFVALETRDKGRPFSAKQIRLFDDLPIAEAVLGALQLLEHADLKFSVDLIRQMGAAAEDPRKVASVLVDSLQRKNEWEHVSVFQVAEERKELTLLAQAYAKDMRNDAEYRQPLDKGLLGLAYSTRATVNAGNVHSEKYKDTYILGVPGTQAEICMPIPGEPIRWILNVESSKENAFADDEEAAMAFLASAVGFILERAAEARLQREVMKSIKDAVLQTDRDGVITQANAAADDLFGAKEGMLRGKPLSDLVDEDDVRSTIVAGTDFSRAQVQLRTLGKDPFPALLSGASLPSELGGRVFVASDLSYQKRVERTELLKDVFRQLAVETKTPLALVSTWVRRAAQDRSQAAELLDKSLRYLKKIDVTLERVLRVSSEIETNTAERAALDLPSVLERLLEQFPQTEQRLVACDIERGLPKVLAARHDLEFCVESLFTHLLHTRSQQDKVVVAARRELAEVVIELTTGSHAGGPETHPAAADGPFAGLRAELAIGKDVVRATLKRMGATLHTSEGSEQRVAIHLPLA